jgi:type III secretion system FlhB-like substrate exporter
MNHKDQPTQPSTNRTIDEDISKMLLHFAQSLGIEVQKDADIAEIIDKLDTVALPDEALKVLDQALMLLQRVNNADQ